MSDTYTEDQAAPAATDAPEVETTDADVEVAPKKRATPRDLEADLKTVLDGIVTGALVIPEGKQATPHVVGKLIGDTLRNGERPSSGAVAAAMDRWATIGYITLSEGPTAFVDYTDAGRTEGLAALKAAHHTRLIEARKLVKAAEAAQAQPEPATADAPF